MTPPIESPKVVAGSSRVRRQPSTRQRMPSVLSRGECRRLFAELDGTTRLMAELMYGSGLRLMAA